MQTSDPDELSEMSIFSPSRWHKLGELILPTDSSPHEVVSLWLTELLTPLGLHENFLNRILESAQTYVQRSLSQDSGAPFGHIHLSIFGLNERRSNSQTWGFFRIEKIDSAEQNVSHPDHTLEFYLYREA
jgi:hypothetical protein